MKFEWKVNKLKKSELMALKEKLAKAFANRNTFKTDHPCYKAIAKRRVVCAIREIRICNREIAYWSEW